MAKDKVYVGDFGRTEILANTETDLTGEVVSLKVLKPGGAEVTWTGTAYDTTWVRHTVQDGELDVSGDYKIQPQVLASDGSYQSTGGTGILHVYSKFE